MGEEKIRNLQSAFAHYLNAELYEKIPEELFFESEDVWFCMPDKGISLIGIQAIREFFQNYRVRLSVKTSVHQWHLVNSPSVRMNGEHAAQSSCLTASFEAEGKNVIHFASRMDTEYREADGQWRIIGMQWYDMAALLPWEISDAEAVSARMCEEQNHDGAAEEQDSVKRKKDSSSVVWDKNSGISTQDYTEIRNAAGRAMQESIARGDAYTMLMSPLIWQGQEEMQGFGAWYGITVRPGLSGEIILELSTVQGEFEKTAGLWRVKEMQFDKVLSLGQLPLTVGAPPGSQEMAAANRQKELSKQGTPHPSPEDVFAIENAASAWVSAIRTCAPYPFYKNYLAVNHPDLYVSVVMPTKGVEGFFRECAMMVRMDELQPKKPGNHTTSTPVIEISADGKEAVATFTDFGWTMMAGAFGNQEAPYPVLPDIARYRHYFVKEGGQWKIWGFNWEVLFQNGNWQYDPQKSRGWSVTKSKHRWPEVFEPYQYLDEEDGEDEFAENQIRPLIKLPDMKMPGNK